MSTWGWLQIGLYIVILLLLVKPLGSYMARVYAGGRTMWDPLLGPVERLTYRWFGIRPDDEMTWTRYAIAFMMLSVVGLIATYGFERLQQLLAWNPEHLGAVPPTSRQLVGQSAAGREFGVLGEPRVNVLELNLRLDGLR